MAEITKHAPLIERTASSITREVRSLYHQALMALLFPFVFLITAFQEGPRRWRENAITTCGAMLLMVLGLACVIAILDKMII